MTTKLSFWSWLMDTPVNTVSSYTLYFVSSQMGFTTSQMIKYIEMAY